MKKNLLNLSLLALATSFTLAACTPPTDPSPTATAAPTAAPTSDPGTGNPQPTAVPSVQPSAPAAKASIVNITEAKFSGKGGDRVGSGSTLSPNGRPDGQIRITLSSPSEIEIKSIQIIQTDAAGNPVNSPKQWVTSPSSNWVIGVVNSNGEQLNKDRNDKNLFGINGSRQYDLFAEAQDGETSYFNAGEYYKVIITDETGATDEQVFSS